MVQQWDRNPDILGRWISKINHLANNSPDIWMELKKIVPQWFTQLAETWYHSIPDAERSRIEEHWVTLKMEMSEYWMNHHWLEKQKIRANKARFREAGHLRESPSEYVIWKMGLLSLVYSYFDTETIQAIMEEIPKFWTSIINPQYQKLSENSRMQSNTTRNLLRNWSHQFLNLVTFLIGNIPTPDFPIGKPTSILLEGQKITVSQRWQKCLSLQDAWINWRHTLQKLWQWKPLGQWVLPLKERRKNGKSKLYPAWKQWYQSSRGLQQFILQPRIWGQRRIQFAGFL